jgi:hypothetical protein
MLTFRPRRLHGIVRAHAGPKTHSHLHNADERLLEGSTIKPLIDLSGEAIGSDPPRGATGTPPVPPWPLGWAMTLAIKVPACRPDGDQQH